MASAVSKFFGKEETKSVLSDYFQILIYSYNKNGHKTENIDIQKVPICEGRYLIKMS